MERKIYKAVNQVKKTKIIIMKIKKYQSHQTKIKKKMKNQNQKQKKKHIIKIGNQCHLIIEEKK